MSDSSSPTSSPRLRFRDRLTLNTNSIVNTQQNPTVPFLLSPPINKIPQKQETYDPIFSPLIESPLPLSLSSPPSHVPIPPHKEKHQFPVPPNSPMDFLPSSSPMTKILHGAEMDSEPMRMSSPMEGDCAIPPHLYDYVNEKLIVSPIDEKRNLRIMKDDPDVHMDLLSPIVEVNTPALFSPSMSTKREKRNSHFHHHVDSLLVNANRLPTLDMKFHDEQHRPIVEMDESEDKHKGKGDSPTSKVNIYMDSFGSDHSDHLHEVNVIPVEVNSPMDIHNENNNNTDDVIITIHDDGKVDRDNINISYLQHGNNEVESLRHRLESYFHTLHPEQNHIKQNDQNTSNLPNNFPYLQGENLEEILPTPMQSRQVSANNVRDIKTTMNMKMMGEEDNDNDDNPILGDGTVKVLNATSVHSLIASKTVNNSTSSTPIVELSPFSSPLTLPSRILSSSPPSTHKSLLNNLSYPTLNSTPPSQYFSRSLLVSEKRKQEERDGVGEWDMRDRELGTIGMFSPRPVEADDNE